MPTFNDLNRDQAVQRMETTHARMELLGAKHRLSDTDQAEFDGLRDEFDGLRTHVDRLDRLADISGAARNGTIRTERGSAGDYDADPIRDPASAEVAFRGRNPWDMAEVRAFGREPHELATELRARALSAIEKMPGANDNIRQAATTIVERFDDKQSSLARQCLATSSPVYLRAWSKMAKMQQHLLSPDEARAIDEVRAMSLTDASGGYLVPFQLDPTVIITSDGSRNDIRRFARQVVATGDKWNGVSSGAVEWSWAAEAAEATDDSTTFAQPSIDIHKAQGFVPISIEALADEANVAQEVGRLLAFGRDSLEAQAFITGTGSGQPKGIITAVAAEAGSVVSPATDETFAIEDVYSVYGGLPARFRGNASWLANNLIYNQIRQFDQYGGAALWTQIGNDRPMQLIGRSLGEAEAMDGVVDADATAAHNYVLLFGDFSQYVIADRVGMSVEFIPHLFGKTNARPTGQRGWYAYYRVGAGVTNNGAFRLLDIPTTA